MTLTRRQALALAVVPLPIPSREARIRAEFAAGDVVVVDGWLLARSEAQEVLAWTR